MSAPDFPFAAVVGQPELKLALLLASVDWRLSVLLKGDKGSGKSTAARALSGILPSDAPFVNLPIGTTEDRLLGGLDLGKALQGQANLKRGLINEADAGVLYVDEINLLSDTLTDALLDVASSGRHYVERDGFSASSEARFILLGSMNVEEGVLRPQLLDRFSLAVDVEAPWTAEERAKILETRLCYDADPIAFCADFEPEQRRLRQAVIDARSVVALIKPSGGILQAISTAIAEAGVRSMRADLATLRAAIVHTALAGRVEVTPGDIESVLPLVLNHRVKRIAGKPPSSTPQAIQPPQNEEESKSTDQQPASRDRVFSPEAKNAPEIRINLNESLSRGRTAAVNNKQSGETTSSGGRIKDASKLDVVASLTKGFRNTGTASLQVDQIVFRRARSQSGARFIFVVDASGSQAARERMRAVKGAAAALLDSSLDRKDEVAVISFRGSKAEIILEPCRNAEAALRALEFLATGGRTPLAHALELANSLVNSASILVLLTDGRANVPLTGTDAWSDALESARKIKCVCILVDSSFDSSDSGKAAALASAMGGTRMQLEEFSKESLMSMLQLG